MIAENAGQKVTPLVLAHLGEWLIRGAYWAIELAIVQHESGAMEKHQLRSIISTNFAALTADLPLAIAQMAQLGYSNEAARHCRFLDDLTRNAATIEQMARNVAAVFERMETGIAPIPHPLVKESQTRRPGW